MDTIYELTSHSYGHSTRLGTHRTIEGAKTAAQIEFEKLQAMFKDFTDEDVRDTEELYRSLQWNDEEQVMFQAGGREFPDGMPRPVAYFSVSSSYQITAVELRD